MEIVERGECPAAYRELDALVASGVLPAGTGLWRSTYHSPNGLAVAPAWYGRRETRHLNLAEEWRGVALPDDAVAPALRAKLAEDRFPRDE